MMLLVVQGIDQVADVLAQPLDIFFSQDASAITMIKFHSEIRRKGISVPENIFYDSLVCCCGHGLEVFIIFDLVYVCPCRQVHVGVFCEYVLRSVYDDSQSPFQYDDDQMVFRTSWF